MKRNLHVRFCRRAHESPHALSLSQSDSAMEKTNLDELPHIFASGRNDQKRSDEELTNTLYQEIGQLKV